MSGKRYTDEFKVKAVRHVTETGHKDAAVAGRLCDLRDTAMVDGDAMRKDLINDLGIANRTCVERIQNITKLARLMISTRLNPLSAPACPVTTDTERGYRAAKASP